MKVLLVNTPWIPDSGNNGLWGVKAGSRWPHFQQRPADGKLPRYIPFPFFLAIAGTILREAGHEVLLIDACAENLVEQDFLPKAKDFCPEIVFCETSSPSLSNDLRIMKALKKNVSEAQFIFSGTHPPELAEELMNESKFPDFWLTGEYEYALKELVQRIDSGADTSGIKGLIQPGGKFQEFAKIDNLNCLPAPLFEQLPINNYSDPVCGLPSPGAQTWLSRGCPYRCTFCVWPQLIYGDRRYRKRDIDRALDEVEILINQYGCESFYFDDDTTNIGEERMVELAKKIIQRQLNRYPWAMMARADCMSERMLKELAEAGLYAIKYGVESISPVLLNACDKGTDLEKLHSAIKATKELGIKTHLTFTFGLPGETHETIMETIEFAIKTAPESAQFSLCTPFPGTEFYQECLKNGWLTSSDWSHFLGSGEDVVISTPQLSAEDLGMAFEEVKQRWSDFTCQRMAKRQKRLISEVKQRISDGQNGTFLGDRDFADFLLADNSIASSLDKGSEQKDFTVIISRHDEEKIFRKLLREGQISPENTIRLFQD